MKIIGKIDILNAFFIETEEDLHYAIHAILIRLEQEYGQLYELNDKKEKK